MSGGWVRIDRKVFEHGAFKPEPFTEREAWMWIISIAAYKATERQIGERLVSLNRGEVALSLRKTAERFGWSKDRVSRFISKLKKCDMIRDTSRDTNRDTPRVYSINNYNKFQQSRDSDEDTYRDSDKPNGETHKKEINKKQKTIGGADAHSNLAFLGRTIRLTSTDYQRWQKSYSAIPDLNAELTKADDYYTENPPPNGKWFFAVSRWLDKAHKDAQSGKRKPGFVTVAL